MPQASQELTDTVIEIVGDRDDESCILYLEALDWTLEPGFVWRAPPRYETYDDIPHDEYLVFLFLIHEWDYGEIVGGASWI